MKPAAPAMSSSVPRLCHAHKDRVLWLSSLFSYILISVISTAIFPELWRADTSILFKAEYCLRNTVQVFSSILTSHGFSINDHSLQTEGSLIKAEAGLICQYKQKYSAV